MAKVAGGIKQRIKELADLIEKQRMAAGVLRKQAEIDAKALIMKDGGGSSGTTVITTGKKRGPKKGTKRGPNKVKPADQAIAGLTPEQKKERQKIASRGKQVGAAETPAAA